MSEAGLIIGCENVGKRLGDRWVLDGIGFRVEAGGSLAVLGPNGAGKSTLLKILAGLWKPDRGEILRFGERVGEPRSDRRIGYLGHRSFLYPALTARENLALTARLWGMDPRGAEPALEAVGLVRFADEPVSTFSRGMLQRAAIARALLPGPQLLLLDEPYTGLDAPGRELLDARLEGFRAGGGSLFLITHDPGEALAHADAVAFLTRGRLTWWDTAAHWSAEGLARAYRAHLAQGRQRPFASFG